MPKHRPCAVIESPQIVEFDLQRSQQLLNPARQGRIAGGWVLHLIEFLRKSTEIVNGPGCRHNGHAGLGNIPMSGDRQNGLWLWSLVAYPPPCFGVAITGQSVHRIAVTDEDCRQQVGHRMSSRSRKMATALRHRQRTDVRRAPDRTTGPRRTPRSARSASLSNRRPFSRW